MYLKSCWKAIVIVFTLCLLALPATSQATYDSLYANSADIVFTDNLWTGGGEYTLAGADLAYHWIYDAGGVRVDYYTAEYGTYTAEWLTYANANNGGTESWLYSAAKDGSYTTAEETYRYEDFNLEYMLYDDGTSYVMEYDFDSDDEAFTGWYDYYYFRNTEASGYSDLYISLYSHNLSWNYNLTNDTSNAQIYESKWFYDPIAGEQWSEDHWKSTATGSYWNSAWTKMGMATGTGDGWSSWSWDYDEETWTNSSFSADYSSFWSSYRENHYSDLGDTYWAEWKWDITDTSYHGSGYSWNNEVDNEGKNFYESWFMNGDHVDRMERWYSQWDEFSSYQAWYEEDTDSGDSYFWEGWQYDNAYSEDYYHEIDFDPEEGNDRDEYYSYTWTKDQLYYYEYKETDTNESNGSTYNEFTVEWRDWTGESSRYYGEGFVKTTQYGYDAPFQEKWYYLDYDQFAKGYYQRRTMEYNWDEWKLTDSEESYLRWWNRTRDAETNNTLTYSSYQARTRSDTGQQYWNYRFEDYTGDNNTTFEEYHGKNIYTDAYNDSKEFEVQDISYERTWSGQDLDEAWSGMEDFDYVGEIYFESEYRKVLASGFQYWDGRYADDSLGTWWHAELANPTGTAWIGNKTAWDGSAYDLYYYAAYPDDFFLVEDQSVPPGFMPDEPFWWL